MKKGVDYRIREIFFKYLDEIMIGVLFLFSLIIRFHFLKHGTSSDFVGYLVPWVNSYRESIRSSFREGVSDYYVAYNVLLAIASKIPIPTNYSVGFISCLFDYFTGIYIYRILSENFSNLFTKKIYLYISIAYLFIPTVVLNGAAWKQCDAIYSFFVVVLIKCLLDGKMRTAFIVFGVAFSFKQQAIFILPLLIILYFLNDKIKIVYTVYSVLVYLIAGLPAIIMGRSALEVYSIYLNQSDAYHEMTLNYPNLYLIAMTDYEKCHIYAKILTVFVLALAFAYICCRIIKISDENIIFLAAWSVWTCCMFLPAMHQRYDYLVAVLMIICLPLAIREKYFQIIISAFLFYLSNIITYSYSLFGDDYDSIFVMSCNVIAYIIFLDIIWKSFKKEEKRIC